MITILHHPLIDHKMALLRNEKTSTKDFKENLDEIASLMTYEIAKDFKTKEVDVKTPIATAKCNVLKDDIVLVPIMRAGLGMVDGIRRLIPTAKVGHIGLYRDEETLIPQTYFAKFPSNIATSTVIITDPMLATGGSASRAIDIVKEKGATDIKLVCIVGVDKGINKVMEDHPDVDIILAAKDDLLNEASYIVPGLGDAGDRIFGTK